MRAKILVITDSLGFPRSSPEQVMYEDTYIALLREKYQYFDIIHQGRGGATIRELYDHSAYYHETLKPEFVFMQSGIVDCAPRALSLTEQHIISRLPLISKPLISLVKANSGFLRRHRNIRFSSKEVYQEYIKKFNVLFDNIYWIGILPASQNYENQLAGITGSIKQYNSILQKESSDGNYISLDNYVETDIMSDFHHLNKSGHARLFNDLSEIVDRKYEKLNNKI